MTTPKLVFRTKGRSDSRQSDAEEISERSPRENVVFVLKRKSDDASLPSVSTLSAFRSTRREVGHLRAKAIPVKLQKVERLQDVKGDVFACVNEMRSAPSTPLPRTRSADKPKHEHEEKLKHDAFDGVVDELLIMALELKTLLKSFLPERDSVKLEEKLNEYLGLLRRMDDMVKDPCLSEKEQLSVSMDVLEALDTGVHPDVHLLQQSEEILKQAEQNVKTAEIIDRFLEIGNQLKQVKDKT